MDTEVEGGEERERGNFKPEAPREDLNRNVQY